VPSRPTRAEARGATRSRLLNAAVEVVAEKGFFGSAIDDIADRAGHTKGAFYFHFQDKAELFLELWQQRTAEELAAIEAIVDSADDPADLLARFRARAEQREDDEQWLLLETEFWLYAMREPSTRHRLAERERAMRAVYRRAIESYFGTVGVAAPGPLDDLALIVHVLGEGVQIRRSIDPDGVRRGFFDDALAFLASAGTALARELAAERPGGTT